MTIFSRIAFLKLLCGFGLFAVVLSLMAYGVGTAQESEDAQGKNIGKSESGSESNADRLVQQAASGAVRFSTPVDFRLYTVNDSLDWAWDFIVAPKRAKSRELVYAYRLRDLDKSGLEALASKLSEEGLTVTLISAADGDRRTSGENHFVGTAVLSGPESLETLMSKINLSAPGSEQLAAATAEIPSAVAWATMVKAGLSPSDAVSASKLSSSAEAYIGLSESAGLNINPIPLIGQKLSYQLP